MISHAAIVPLIGGLPIGLSRAFNSKPSYILSYEPFASNDSHLVNYWSDVPYYMLEGTNEDPRHPKVDVVSVTCPCAGLSSLSPSASSFNPKNDWMTKTSEYVLSKIEPRVVIGENAPRLATALGEPVVKSLIEIGDRYGYTFSLYKTKSILHGQSQVRDRSFYFFWKEQDRIPIFEYYNRPHEKIEDVILNTPRLSSDPMSQILTNEKKPTDNPFYRFVLEEIEGGISHAEFSRKIKKTVNPLDYLEQRGYTYDVVHDWMIKNKYEKEARTAKRAFTKLASGGNIMRKTTEIVKDHIGAFVGHFVNSCSHPTEDRYLTVREALEIMKMPRDFVLLGGRKNLNHICQNVITTTAEDMGKNIVKYLEGKAEMMTNATFMIQDNKSRSIQKIVSNREHTTSSSLSDFF